MIRDFHAVIRKNCSNTFGISYQSHHLDFVLHSVAVKTLIILRNTPPGSRSVASDRICAILYKSPPGLI